MVLYWSGISYWWRRHPRTPILSLCAPLEYGSYNNPSKGFWITLPKNHFTDIFWPKGHLTETPFDRTPFDRMPFDRKLILPKKVISPKTKFIKRSFDRKYLENGQLTKNLTWKTNQMTEMTYDWKFIWPKAFRKMVIWPKKKHSVKWTFSQMTFHGWMAFGQTVFGQIVFRSMAFRSKFFGEMIFW
jgi:hypothetical protein